MSEIVFPVQSGFFAPRSPTSTAGADAQEMQRKQFLEQFRYPPKERIAQELRNLLDPIAVELWFGSDNQPVARKAVLNGLRLLSLLSPAELTDLEISPDSDGGVSFDWHLANEKQLTVSLGADGELYYAAILGPVERLSGRLPFHDSIPEEVSRILRRLAR